MIRALLAVIALLAAAIVVGVVALRGGDEDGYRVRAIFDNAGFVIPGEDVKIAGVKVGKITDLEVTDDFKAAVTLEITEPGYQDFRSDATCIVRPQSLIGERFVECTPTQPRSASAQPPPELEEVDGARLLPVENTMQSVDIDLIGNTMREPERERLSLILNEFGTGLAGRGRDLNEVIRRANPALRETNRVLEILAEQNTQLEQLAVNSDRILAPLARDRREVAGAIRESSAVARATAERRDDLAAAIETLPAFLDEFEPTMERLGALADESIPVFDDLGAQAPAINRVIRDLGPLSAAAMPAIESLGEASKTGIPALTDARPVIADTRRLARAVRPTALTLRELLESFERTGGIGYAMEYIFYQVAAINGFDALGHYLRAELLVNQCVNYVVVPQAGCSANFAGASASSAVPVAADEDGELRRTADSLARALDEAVEEVKEEGTPAPSPSPAPSSSPELPTATPTASASPAASPTAAPAPSADPSGALLDFLFGGDG